MAKSTITSYMYKQAYIIIIINTWWLATMSHTSVKFIYLFIYLLSIIGLPPLPPTSQNDIDDESSRSSRISSSKRRKLESNNNNNNNNSDTLKRFYITSLDVVFEVLLRLPDWRYLMECCLVCKEWLALIFDPWFVARFGHYHLEQSRISPAVPDLPSLVLRDTLSHRTAMFSPRRYRTRGFDKMPCRQPSVVASFGDLILVRDSTSRQRFSVCDPQTRRRIAVPNPPLPYHILYNSMYGLVCSSDYCAANTPGCSCKAALRPFKIVLIMLNDHVSRYDGVVTPPGVAVYCSETRRWSRVMQLDLNLPPSTDLRCHTKLVVAINGILYWLLVGRKDDKVRGVAHFDPFKRADELMHSFFIGLPVEFHRGWRSLSYRVHMGTVCGRLRISQLFKIKAVGFVLKIWELRTTSIELISNTCVKEGKYVSAMWDLLHDDMVTNARTDFMSVVAFHPSHGDVIFLLRDICILEYNVLECEYKELGEFPVANKEIHKSVAMKQAIHSNLTAFALAHPPWPASKLPRLPRAIAVCS